MFVLQKQSSKNEKLPVEEDLSEEVYYSDEDADNLLSGHAATSAAENVANHQPAGVSQDPAALLSQLTSGGFPSQSTIQLAVAQLMEAITTEEKQLMAQLMQQMVMMNPMLAAASPLALQVEAIRIVLTTRSQRALVHGVPGVQQMAQQAQLQNLPPAPPDASAGITGVVQCEDAMIEAELSPVPAAVSHQEDMPHQTEMLKPTHRRLSDDSTHQVPVTKCSDQFTLDSGSKLLDECGSTSSDHVWQRAGQRPARGRGRGIYHSGFHYDDDGYRDDRPRGRGARRSKPVAADDMNPGNSSAAVSQPLVPPPQLTSQSSDSRDKHAASSSENWEEEIDEFGSEVFHVDSSFYKSGKR